jgi:hypothetical protein
MHDGGGVMRWQLIEHWPTDGGAHLIPAGTFIEGPELRSPITGLPLPPPLPINAFWACDQEAYDQLCAWYGPEFYHRLRFDPHNVQPKQSPS